MVKAEEKSDWVFRSKLNSQIAFTNPIIIYFRIILKNGFDVNRISIFRMDAVFIFLKVSRLPLKIIIIIREINKTEEMQ